MLASSPSTIVIFAVATAVSADSNTDLITTLYFSAVGLFGDALFLWLWRELPSALCFARYVQLRSRLSQAALMATVTIFTWLVYAIVLIFASQAVLDGWRSQSCHWLLLLGGQRGLWSVHGAVSLPAPSSFGEADVILGICRSVCSGSMQHWR